MKLSTEDFCGVCLFIYFWELYDGIPKMLEVPAPDLGDGGRSIMAIDNILALFLLPLSVLFLTR